LEERQNMAEYTEDKVREAIGEGVNLVLGAIGGGSERERDVVGLVVAEAACLSLSKPNVTFAEVVDEKFAGTTSADAVLGWWNNWD
jgi:hypothetical protein